MVQSWPGWPWGGFNRTLPELLSDKMADKICEESVVAGVLTVTGDAAVVALIVAAGGEFNGAPTAISQRWPGCPCEGFNWGEPASVFAVAVLVFLRFVFEGAEFKGAPTGISHRCPGWP